MSVKFCNKQLPPYMSAFLTLDQMSTTLTYFNDFCQKNNEHNYVFMPRKITHGIRF